MWELRNLKMPKVERFWCNDAVSASTFHLKWNCAIIDRCFVLQSGGFRRTPFLYSHCRNSAYGNAIEMIECNRIMELEICLFAYGQCNNCRGQTISFRYIMKWLCKCHIMCNKCSLFSFVHTLWLLHCPNTTQHKVNDIRTETIPCTRPCLHIA